MTLAETNQPGGPLSAAEINALDNRHVLRPWAGMGPETPDRKALAGGDGIYLIDPEGRRFIDGPGGMWNVQIGYGRREIGEAMAEQAMRLGFNSPWAFAAEPSALLARKLAELSPGDLNTVFLTTGGSTAVDTALRFTRFYHRLRGKPEKRLFIARQRAYHGSTWLTASVSFKERDGDMFEVDKSETRFLSDINPYRRPAGMSVEAWTDARIAEFETLIAQTGAETIAAYISEPIMASGGVVVPPPGYHRRTWDICRKHDILYISDEVVTGFGRLGCWFASEDVFGFTPDIITCAKGITSGYAPLGATLISDGLMEAIRSEANADVFFKNGYTYTGHPVCCAAALKNIEILEREDLLGHVREVAPHFQERLAALKRHAIVGDARGMGLVGCVEGRPDPALPDHKALAVDQEFGARVDARCEALGLMVRPLINMCVVSPPLVITRDQIDAMFDILDRAIGEVQRDMM
jgi:adenosylmethionine-8-amino-7-oxononanoate aminotransferase